MILLTMMKYQHLFSHKVRIAVPMIFQLAAFALVIALVKVGMVWYLYMFHYTIVEGHHFKNDNLLAMSEIYYLHQSSHHNNFIAVGRECERVLRCKHDLRCRIRRYLGIKSAYYCSQSVGGSIGIIKSVFRYLRLSLCVYVFMYMCRC